MDLDRFFYRSGSAMKFVQIIEFTTSKMDEMKALMEEWESEGNTRQAAHGFQTQDRDSANTYLTIVEFESYEAAMANSNRPETAAFAARMAALCDGPPTFRNLDVLEEFNG